MTDQSRLQFTDAVLEKMLAQRAGPGAPADLIPSVAAAIETTGQRAPGLLGAVSGRGASRTRRDPGTLTSRRILQVAALGMAVVVVAAGAGLFLRLSPALIGGPSSPPSIAPVPSSSVAPSPSPSPIATPRPAAVVAYTKYVFRTNSMAETGRVWIVGADGTGAHELFPGGTGDQSGVAWSPDGTRLVYTEAGRLYLTDAGGTAPQVVDTGCASACSDGSAAFSTDGTRLVFVRGASAVIATIDLASGRVVELGSTGATANERPRWSPDGKQIVFSRQDKFNNGSAVFVVDSDGQNLRQLSPASLPAHLPEWSPDGSRILFTSLGIKYVRVAGTNTQQITQDVYTVGPDWTDLRRLTKDGNSIGATWTPDGRILFSTGCRGDCAATGGLWTMDADGGNPELFVPGGSGVDAPLWGIDAAWQPTP